MGDGEKDGELLSHWYKSADILRDFKGEEDYVVQVSLDNYGNVRIREGRSQDEINVTVKELKTVQKIINELLAQ